MARYKLILAYDGTDFAGSQRQAKRRTVQGELESALRKLDWYGRSVTSAGRTDSGVHASGQVVAFDIEWNHGLEKLRDALNANLPDDIAVKSVEVADEKFHPRFDAKSRCYRYRMFCENVRDPLREKFAWRILPNIHEEILVDAAKIFFGQHDFSAFGSALREESSTTRRSTFESGRWWNTGRPWSLCRRWSSSAVRPERRN